VRFSCAAFITIADNLTEIIAAFEAIEKEAVLLQDFMARAKSNYDIAIKDLVYRPAFRHWN
jgi:phytoene desaturase